MRVTAWSAIAVLGGLTLVGCGGPSAKITGTVTCGGKPVAGSILFSPKGENDANKGPAVPTELKEDGTYELRLTTVGLHTVVITPRDMKYPAKHGAKRDQFEFP